MVGNAAIYERIDAAVGPSTRARLHALGAGYPAARPRQDADGLLPALGPFVRESRGEYEIEYAMALALLARAANPTFSEELVAIFDGFDTFPAPSKAFGRMRNKLESATEHGGCETPRAAENADVLRLGVVLDTPEDFEEALAVLRRSYAILRVKSSHDAVAPSYRSLLVNLRYASTRTLADVVGSHDDDLGRAWKDHCETLPEPRHWRYALNSLHRLAASRPAPAIALAAEVQFVLRPYYAEGRTRSHLLFKIARAATPGEMVRDFSQGLEPIRLPSGPIDHRSSRDPQPRTQSRRLLEQIHNFRARALD